MKSPETLNAMNEFTRALVSEKLIDAAKIKISAPIKCVIGNDSVPIFKFPHEKGTSIITRNNGINKILATVILFGIFTIQTSTY